MERIDVRRLFGHDRPVVGMVHLLPLPGAPGWAGSMPDVLDRALGDAHKLAAAGADGIIVENYGDAPFRPGRLTPETCAALALAAAHVVNAVAVPVGVNALRNDARTALAVALASGARFIRANVHVGAMLTDQGWIAGRAHGTLRLRAALRAPIAIFADVLVKHAVAPAGVTIEAATRDAWHRGLADALVVSGPETGAPADADRLRRARAAVPDAPLFIGSGLDAANVADLLPLADGAIVGSTLERDGVAGRPVDQARARAFIAAARALD